ncbi:uncharacterized protein B0I36DRAFT_385345 [Microdochium trichocladiopsis]|uniref:Transmembrane protein n=1 Tax=Microdochium trichocladiopsis TaxID=1682393 RepID=A0A9P9BNE9_9PEZI|nr:uncharacterized protein B0I36DRAFT_385345 [Microdochium trichocladiopsis]KAH7027309.1 hypothetical protein B0I36DRAFT_385345 [Microdochium trichocladiopsis]
MDNNSITVGDLVPQLANFSLYDPDPAAIYRGAQNFSQCCVRALDQSLYVDASGNLSYSSSSYVDPKVTIAELTAAIAGGSTDLFPCGASYGGDPQGSPEIRVPYRWCASECAGWEMSHAHSMQQWIGPAVQFIVPSLAFCLNIPRTRSLAIPDAVFKAHPRSVLGLASYWLRLLAAMLLMFVDTFLWLAICFAFAGPMLLSAVFEYMVDRKILEFLVPPTRSKDPPRLPLRLKAQFLIAVVAGNIRMSTVEKNCDEATISSAPVSPVSTTFAEKSASSEDKSTGGVDSSDSKDERVENLDLESMRFTPLSRSTTHRIVHNAIWKRIMTMIDDHEDQVARGITDVVSLPTKLKSILNSQPSFGTTIGAPVLFFVGGFIYTVLDVENNLGDNDTAHALAFGMWWMVIPYLAIISSAMLAANEPFALEGIVYDGGKEALKDAYDATLWASFVRRARRHQHIDRFLNSLHGYSLVGRCFDGHFKTVKLWKRGLNKSRWVKEAIDEYTANYSRARKVGRSSVATLHPGNLNTAELTPPVDVRAALGLKFHDIWNVGVGSSFLMLTPCVLAFLVSYNTPRNGLSCRTLTYLVYAITQVCEMLLWSWEARLKIKYGPQRWSQTRTPAKLVCWWGQVFVGFFAILAAVGGTMMQLLGIPVTYWNGRLDDPDAYIILSSNTAASIRAAGTWWTYTAVAAVATVSLVCALAWWHQRRLKKVFMDVADSLEGSIGSA